MFSLTHFNNFFNNLFFNFIYKCQKETLRCAPPSSHVCYFWLIFFNWLSNVIFSNILLHFSNIILNAPSEKIRFLWIFQGFFLGIIIWKWASLFNGDAPWGALVWWERVSKKIIEWRAPPHVSLNFGTPWKVTIINF